MFWYDLFGYGAIVFSFLAFLSLSTFRMRFLGLFSSLTFAISIFGYGGINGAFVSIISFSIKALSLKFSEDTLKPLLFSSPIIAVVFYFYFNTEGMIGILPAISLIFIITATLQKDVLNMKYIYIGSAVCWFIYAIIIGSVPAILFDIVNSGALIYSIIKIKKSRKLEQVNL